MTTTTTDHTTAAEERSLLHCPDWCVSDHSQDLRDVRTHPREHQIRHLGEDVLKDCDELEVSWGDVTAVPAGTSSSIPTSSINWTGCGAANSFGSRRFF